MWKGVNFVRFKRRRPRLCDNGIISAIRIFIYKHISISKYFLMWRCGEQLIVSFF